jgi:Tol biopolymer transport system component
MEKSTFIISSLAITLMLLTGCTEKDEFPVFRGPYLGQEPPGITPEIFAPGIISTAEHDHVYTFLRDGKYCIFSRGSSSEENPIYHTYITEMNQGVWTEPVLTQFSKVKSDDTLSLLPDENSVLFSSAQSPAGPGKSDKGYNIWIVKLTNTGLSNPRIFYPPVNSDHNDIFPSITNDGTIYFFSNRDDTFTNEDIYRAKLINGKYTEVERLGSPVNTENDEIDPFIAPDESYLIYCSKTLEGFGGYDLYITFRTPKDSWTEPINMGEGINSSGYDWIPFVTPDEKYFFFNSDRSGNADVYWVDAKVIKEMKPEKFQSNVQENTYFPVLKGPYLGQNSPGMTPEIFAPGFISTEKAELNSVFTPDGKEFYFSIYTEGKGCKIYFSKEEGSGWSRPEPVPFSSQDSDVDMCMTPDGMRMYFGSTRPVNGIEQKDYKIWYVDRVGDGWSQAKYLKVPINNGRRALYPSISNNGTMFFQAVRDDSFGSRDIYYSTLSNGRFTEPIHLGREINSEFSEGDVLIAPDESYMIVNSSGRPDDLGNSDLYISFKKEDGSWTKLMNMGNKINSPETDYCPMLSPDGKYFFFTSKRSGNGDIYWIDAKIINGFKQIK